MLNQSKLKTHSAFKKSWLSCDVCKIYVLLENKVLADTETPENKCLYKTERYLSNILKSCEEKMSRDFKLTG